MIAELTKYKSKLRKLSKMSAERIDVSIHQVLKNITLVSPEAISYSHWKQAFELTSDVDENDTPFLATAISINAAIWTGDKKLINGLMGKGFQNIYSTAALFDLRK